MPPRDYWQGITVYCRLTYVILSKNSMIKLHFKLCLLSKLTKLTNSLQFAQIHVFCLCQFLVSVSIRIYIYIGNKKITKIIQTSMICKNKIKILARICVLLQKFNETKKTTTTTIIIIIIKTYGNIRNHFELAYQITTTTKEFCYLYNLTLFQVFFYCNRYYYKFEKNLCVFFCCCCCFKYLFKKDGKKSV